MLCPAFHQRSIAAGITDSPSSVMGPVYSITDFGMRLILWSLSSMVRRDSEELPCKASYRGLNRIIEVLLRPVNMNKGYWKMHQLWMTFKFTFSFENLLRRKQ